MEAAFKHVSVTPPDTFDEGPRCSKLLKCDNTGYFEGDMGTISSRVCCDPKLYFKPKHDLLLNLTR